MTNSIDKFYDSLGKEKRIDYTQDQIKTMENLTKTVIKPAFEDIAHLTNKRTTMISQINNSKTKATNTFEDYEILIKENHQNKLMYRIRFDLTEKSELVIKRIYADEFDNLYNESREKVETFVLNRLIDFNQKMIEEDFVEKLTMAFQKKN